LNCNIGFLNPPYSDKIYSEIAFAELLLDSLLPGGLGIAIIPVNSVSSRTKVHNDILETKKRILEKHNLIASIQMPINLFYPKGTETIIVVFKTGEPNSGSTWLARYDDGYELIRQRKARTPTLQAQDCHDNLVEAYNLRLETDFSFNKVLDYRDQWVYTVHEASDYSVTQQDLQVVLNEYISYLYQNHYN
jgi:type I restriction-modification system DNA methylase subunit